MKQKSKKKEYKTLLSALAYGSTDDAQKLLAKYGVKEANTYDELEYNLAKLYSNQTDKIELEKQFAEIHPHSKFILKYLAPKPQERPEDKDLKDGNETPPTVVEMTSSASGDCGCSKMSNADGETSNNNLKLDINSLALVSIVAIVGLVIIAKK